MKVINPLGKGGYEIHSLESHAVFVTVADLKQDILSSCEQHIEMDKELQFGYVVPGHGKKGKQLAHGERYTKEQTRAWAVLIHIGKHDCYESPPDKHFFKFGKKGGAASSVGVSSGKRLSLRSEFIDQLDKWHCLMESGVITAEQYKEIQDDISYDIKKV